ncbi:MAG TPA: helix-turn-helix domain-containing protein [Stellaceae bacterium]|nr:helix-turn-helix domain-containing protein [Stellaceae bacterium]
MKLSARARTITTVEQAQIIQRVLVERWSTAEAAAAFGLEKRLVAAWVADYRRHGMASLQRAPSRSLTAEIFRLKLAQPLAALWRRSSGGVRRLVVRKPVAEPAPLRLLNDDRRGS